MNIANKFTDYSLTRICLFQALTGSIELFVSFTIKVLYDCMFGCSPGTTVWHICFGLARGDRTFHWQRPWDNWGSVVGAVLHDLCEVLTIHVE